MQRFFFLHPDSHVTFNDHSQTGPSCLIDGVGDVAVGRDADKQQLLTCLWLHAALTDVRQATNALGARGNVVETVRYSKNVSHAAVEAITRGNYDIATHSSIDMCRNLDRN